MSAKFLTPLFSLYNKDRLEEIREACAMPYDAQNELLFEMLSDAASTEWGKRYRFSRIHSYDDFRQRLPLQQYEDILPYVQRMMAGEGNLLWPGTCKYFVPAGEKNLASHLLPITRDALMDNFYEGIYDSMAMYLKDKGEDSKLFDSFSLWIGASKRDQVYRNLSNILIKEAPFPQSLFIRPQSPVNKSNAHSELEVLLEESQKGQVSNIQGRPHRYFDFLKYAEQKTGKSGIKNILPQVEVFFHRGRPTRAYLQQAPIQDIDYHASFCTAEGFFGMQEKLGEDAMLLHMDAGIFYEFIPVDAELKAENVVPLEEVQLEHAYRMIISTRAGLWRYLSEGPAVVFVSNRPYKFYIQ